MKKKLHLKIPKGWRELGDAEEIQEGDKVWAPGYRRWFSAGAIGETVSQLRKVVPDIVYIRLKKK